MQYQVEFKPKAVKDLKSLDRKQTNRIVESVERMRENLTGDVKHLTEFTPEYRLRAGDYRVLFEIEDDMLVIYRVLHRSRAYGA